MYNGDMRFFPRIKLSIERPVRPLRPECVQAFVDLSNRVQALETATSRIEKRQQRGKDESIIAPELVPPPPVPPREIQTGDPV